MKNIYFPLSCLVSILTGCLPQPPWHLNAQKQGDTVQLCLSRDSQCPQPGGVSLDDISVYRYDNMHDNELIWEAASDNPITSGSIDGIVTYGVPPKNWQNKLTPPALVCGKPYLVNPPASFFALKCDGTVVLFDFQHLEEFFRQDASPAPTKKQP